MDRLRERLSMAHRALATLGEVVAQPAPPPIQRDAAIKRFEYSVETVWKAAQLYLRAREAGHGVHLVGEAVAYHATSSATGGGYNPRRKYMMGVNSIWFLKRHARAREWARFVVYDVLTLPFLWLAGLFRGRAKSVVGKALGILDGLRGKRVTSASIEKGAGWLW